MCIRDRFYNGRPKTMLLSLAGMDGYLSYSYPQNYYFIGEWFLGALVCLYLIYPLLTLCMKYCKILTTLLLGAGTLAFHWNLPFFQIPRERNLIVCLFAFWLGMLFIRYREKLSALWITVIFGGIALFLLLSLIQIWLLPVLRLPPVPPLLPVLLTVPVQLPLPPHHRNTGLLQHVRSLHHHLRSLH